MLALHVIESVSSSTQRICFDRVRKRAQSASERESRRTFKSIESNFLVRKRKKKRDLTAPCNPGRKKNLRACENKRILMSVAQFVQK